MKNLLIGAALVAAVFFVAWQATQNSRPKPPRQAPPDVQTPSERPEATPPAPEPAVEEPAPAPAPAPVVAPAPPTTPVNPGRTVLDTRREDCLYLCGKCNKIFTPTYDSMQVQVRLQWSDPIDCPLCNQPRCAYFAETCPSCELIYPQFVNTKRDPATGVMHKLCPRCGTDPVEWVLRIRRSRDRSPQSPGATVLGPRREDFRFLCRKCENDFSPTPESAQQQTRGQGKDAIDCPLCYARACASLAICCPKCKHVYLPVAASRGASAPPAICPRCNTDAVEWFRQKHDGK